jgi:hypothetical protein
VVLADGVTSNVSLPDPPSTSADRLSRARLPELPEQREHRNHEPRLDANVQNVHQR